VKKSDLKQLIKPVVKECIHEVLLEEGLLSNVVSEVMRGLQGAPLVENKRTEIPPQPQKTPPKATTQLLEHRKKMLDAIGKDAYNGVDLFEGTQPAPSQEPSPGSVDLGNPRDPGVDISSILGDASKIWRAIK